MPTGRCPRPGGADAPAADGDEDDSTKPMPRTGRRVPIHPLITVARSASQADALAGLDRWRARHPEAAASVRDPEDVLIDAMRGRFTVWWRVRVNLRNVPESLRPAAEPPDPDYDPWADVR